MASRVMLLLICTLFSKALSLTCQQCIPSANGTCNIVQTTCPDQCLTSTTSLYINGQTTLSNYNIKDCSVAGLCGIGSMNLGMVKLTYNAKCCSTDLCNAETLPALPQQSSNGMTCYSCDANGCSSTVSCTGNEDQCISASIQQGSSTVFTKGCVSKNLCDASGSTSIPGVGVSNMQCCQGNLCNGAGNNTGSSSGNGAESFTLSFLLMIVPLLSVLFY